MAAPRSRANSWGGSWRRNPSALLDRMRGSVMQPFHPLSALVLVLPHSQRMVRPLSSTEILLAYAAPASSTPWASGENRHAAISRFPMKYSQGCCGDINRTHLAPSLNRLGHSIFQMALSLYWNTTPRNLQRVSSAFLG